jgi:hypothetical protein
MERNEELKQEHIQAANAYIRKYEEVKDSIANEELRSHLDALFRSLRDLRDTEYLFESGEKDVSRLYDAYLPMINQILEDYGKLSSAAYYSRYPKIKNRLIQTVDLLKEAVDMVNRELPQDEIREAAAQTKAVKMKQKLDQASADFRISLKEEE